MGVKAKLCTTQYQVTTLLTVLLEYLDRRSDSHVMHFIWLVIFF